MLETPVCALTDCVEDDQSRNRDLTNHNTIDEQKVMGSLRAADKLAAGGELMKAHALYETAANRNVPGAYERLCHTRHLLGRHAEALSCCETALQLHPGNSFLLSLDGQVALELGRIERAIESYKRASTQNPRDGDLSNNLGIALSAAGRYADAAARLHQAVDRRA